MGCSMSSQYQVIPYPAKMARYDVEDRPSDTCHTTRKLYDKISTVLFVAVLLSFVCLCAFSTSDNQLLDPGVDYRMDQCRQYHYSDDQDIDSKPYLYYANFQSITSPDTKLIGICVKACPRGDQTAVICVPENEADTDGQLCYPEYASHAQNSYCLPDVSTAENVYQLKQYVRMFITDVLSQVSRNVFPILTYTFVAIGIGFTWLFLVHRIPRFILGASFFLAYAGTVCLAILSLAVGISTRPKPREAFSSYNATVFQSDEITTSSASPVLSKTLTLLGVFLAFQWVIMTVTLIRYRKKLSFVASISELSGKVFRKFYLALSCLSFLCLVAVSLLATYLLVFLANNSISDNFKIFGIALHGKTRCFVQIFALAIYFWCLNYFSGIFTMITSNVFSGWYWSNLEGGQRTSSVREAVGKTIHHHQSSVTLGSIYVSNIHLAYFILLFINLSGGLMPGTTVFIGFLLCLQYLAVFINRITYVTSSITNLSYFKSSILAVHTLIRYREILCTFFITFFVRLVGFIFIYILNLVCISAQTMFTPGVSPNPYAVLTEFVVAFVISYLVTEIYSVGIDTFVYSFFYEKSFSDVHIEPAVQHRPAELSEFGAAHTELDSQAVYQHA